VPHRSPMPALRRHRLRRASSTSKLMRLVRWRGRQSAPAFQTGDGGGAPVRLTLVLANEDGSWRIVQSYASTAAID